MSRCDGSINNVTLKSSLDLNIGFIFASVENLVFGNLLVDILNSGDESSGFLQLRDQILRLLARAIRFIEDTIIQEVCHDILYGSTGGISEHLGSLSKLIHINFFGHGIC